VGLLAVMTSCSHPSLYEQKETLYKLGDQPEWAERDWNDDTWNEQQFRFVLNGQVYWMRTEIELLKSSEPFQPYGIQLEVYGEYEVFWDGVMIGKNGNPGQEAELEPEGILWPTFRIPTKLTEKGTHVLAIRASLLHFPDHTGIWDLELDGYDALLTDRLIETSYTNIFAGSFLIAAFYFFLLFLGNKKEYLMLVFSLSCLLFFALTITQFLRVTVPIHYSLHHVRLDVIGALMLGISLLIPLFFSLQFPFPWRKWVMGLYMGSLLILFFFRHNRFEIAGTNNMALGAWALSLAIVLYGVYKKEKGTLLVLLTLLACVPLTLAASFRIALFVGFSLILLSMLYLLSLRIQAQRLAYENSLVQSTRLRLQLLKKNIQPHFLMNTLTSLIDWVEEAPKKGVRFIEALAREFDLFNQVEEETLIPITQEIALCRSQLEIMEYRKEINYVWEEEGIDPKQTVPPAILHTLVENGLTHSLPLGDNTIRFRLTFEATTQARTYTLLTFAKPIPKEKPIEDGTGQKYVKARLAESYGSHWEFTSEPAPHGWKNTIKILTQPL